MGGGLAVRRSSRPKRNGAALHAALARAWGAHLLEDAPAPQPDDGALHIPMPSLDHGPSNIIAKPAALMVRTIVLYLPGIKDATKRRSLGGLLIALADGLEALQIEDGPAKYWLRD